MLLSPIFFLFRGLNGPCNRSCGTERDPPSRYRWDLAPAWRAVGSILFVTDATNPVDDPAVSTGRHERRGGRHRAAEGEADETDPPGRPQHYDVAVARAWRGRKVLPRQHALGADSNRRDISLIGVLPSSILVALDLGRLLAREGPELCLRSHLSDGFLGFVFCVCCAGADEQQTRYSHQEREPGERAPARTTRRDPRSLVGPPPSASRRSLPYPY